MDSAIGSVVDNNNKRDSPYSENIWEMIVWTRCSTLTSSIDKIIIPKYNSNSLL